MFTDAIMLYGLIESKGGWKAKGKKLLVFEYFCTYYIAVMKFFFYENLLNRYKNFEIIIVKYNFSIQIQWKKGWIIRENLVRGYTSDIWRWKKKLYPRNVVSKAKRKSVSLFIFIEKRSNKGYTYTES